MKHSISYKIYIIKNEENKSSCCTVNINRGVIRHIAHLETFASNKQAEVLIMKVG